MKDGDKFTADLVPTEAAEMIARAAFDPSVGAVRIWFDDTINYEVMASEVRLVDMVIETSGLLP